MPSIRRVLTTCALGQSCSEPGRPKRACADVEPVPLGGAGCSAPTGDNRKPSRCRTPIAGHTVSAHLAGGSGRAGWVTWSANRDGAIDRHRIAEQVQNRAMLIDGCRKLLIAL